MKALIYAAANGHDKIVAFLIQYGMGCDDRDSLGETPLVKASQNGQAIMAKLLLEGGADPLLSGGEQFNSVYRVFPHSADLGLDGKPLPVALHHAASNGHDNVLAILPYSDVTCGAYRTNALHLGAAYGHPNVVAALLLKGAKMESKDSMGMTALHYASRNGHILVIQLLLDKGCKIDQEADLGYTALHFAAETAEVEVIKYLVAHGAAISAKISEPEEYTALHVAARHRHANTVRVLVECGAPVEKKGRHGQTALDEAIDWDSPANVRALIELGAEWIRDQTFNYAINVKTEDTVEIFLSKLSTATAKKRGNAAAVMLETLRCAGRGTNKEAVRMLQTWRRNEESDPHT